MSISRFKAFLSGVLYVGAFYVYIYAMTDELKQKAVLTQIESEMASKNYESAIKTIDRAADHFSDITFLKNIWLKKADILFNEMKNTTAGYEFMHGIQKKLGQEHKVMFEAFVIKHASEYTSTLLAYLNHVIYQYCLNLGEFPESLETLLSSKKMSYFYALDGWGERLVYERINLPILKNERPLWYNLFSVGEDRTRATKDDLFAQRSMSSQADESMQLIESRRIDSIWQSDIRYFNQGKKRFEVQTVGRGDTLLNQSVFYIDERSVIMLDDTGVQELVKIKP